MDEVVCARCGALEDPGGAAVPLTWSAAPDGDGDAVRLLCGDCTRRHVRDIEAKLDETWWT